MHLQQLAELQKSKFRKRTLQGTTHHRWRPTKGLKMDKSPAAHYDWLRTREDYNAFSRTDMYNSATSLPLPLLSPYQVISTTNYSTYTVVNVYTWRHSHTGVWKAFQLDTYYLYTLQLHALTHSHTDNVYKAYKLTSNSQLMAKTIDACCLYMAQKNYTKHCKNVNIWTFEQTGNVYW